MRAAWGILAAALLAVSWTAAVAQTGGLWPPGSARQRLVAPHCADCWVQEVTARPAAGAPMAAPSNPTCYGQPSIDFFRTALLVVAPRTPAAASGDLAEAIRLLARPMFEALREGSAADFRSLLRLPQGEVPYANCAPLAVLLPSGAMVEAVAVGVLAGGAARGCDPVGGVCGDGGRFVQPPVRFAAADRLGVGAVFMAADSSPPTVRLLVAYRIPPGGQPAPLQ